MSAVSSGRGTDRGMALNRGGMSSVFRGDGGHTSRADSRCVDPMMDIRANGMQADNTSEFGATPLREVYEEC